MSYLGQTRLNKKTCFFKCTVHTFRHQVYPCARHGVGYHAICWQPRDKLLAEVLLRATTSPGCMAWLDTHIEPGLGVTTIETQPRL